MIESIANDTTTYPTLASLTETERHALLSSTRRRLTLSILADRTTPIELPELAKSVADREVGLDADDGDDLERVKVSLHHVHLPKLMAYDLVDYAPDERLVTP